MKIIFSPASPDDVIRLLKAWRFWLLGAVAGALIGAVVYLIAPPPYRARATVNVDFHMELAWPESSDREQFYYLERETRKLEEIAMSDGVLNQAAAQAGGVDVSLLRNGKLQLSQPGNGGWHFYADDRDPEKAMALASDWAQVFAESVQAQVASPSGGLEQYITATPTQTDHLTARRSLSLGLYMFAGSAVLLALVVLGVLFFRFER